MISNQILQSMIDGLSQITGTALLVVDTEGVRLAGTLEDSEISAEDMLSFISSGNDVREDGSLLFFKVFDESRQLYYVLVVSGDGSNARMIGKIAVFQIQNLLVAYREKFDKDNFIKNLLLDNLLKVDIYNSAKKLHIESEYDRIAMIVEVGEEYSITAIEAIREFFSSAPEVYVTAVNEDSVTVVYGLDGGDNLDESGRVAAQILECMKKLEIPGVRVAYGTVVHELKDTSRSYKEARLALDVGRIFFGDRDIIEYSSLGIGRLIYQLPMPLCNMFIQEIFGGRSPDEFDEETLSTINKFFENSLNVSETSRQLFIHRNTLVYRLDKLQKNTGLDLRVFEDAITFKIALMVSKYMKYIEGRSF